MVILFVPVGIRQACLCGRLGRDSKQGLGICFRFGRSSLLTGLPGLPLACLLVRIGMNNSLAFETLRLCNIRLLRHKPFCIQA